MPRSTKTQSGDGKPPLYRQVKDRIVARIRSGELEPGARVPSEHDFVESLGVSRMTVNRALRELTAEGWLTREQGVGTFVADARSETALIEVRPIADEIAERGGVHSARVDWLGDLKADADAAAALAVPVGSVVFLVVLVHFEDGEPIQIEDRLVNPAVAPDFLEQDFTAITPSAYLLREVPLTEIEHVIEARMPTADERSLLALPAAEPCLVLVRRTWAYRDVVTRARFVHPGGVFRIGSRFAPLRSRRALVA